MDHTKNLNCESWNVLTRLASQLCVLVETSLSAPTGPGVACLGGCVLKLFGCCEMYNSLAVTG